MNVKELIQELACYPLTLDVTMGDGSSPKFDINDEGTVIIS